MHDCLLGRGRTWRHWEKNKRCELWSIFCWVWYLCSVFLAAGFLYFASWAMRYWFPVRSKAFHLSADCCHKLPQCYHTIVFLSSSLCFASESWLGKLSLTHCWWCANEQLNYIEFLDLSCMLLLGDNLGQVYYLATQTHSILLFGNLCALGWIFEHSLGGYCSWLIGKINLLLLQTTIMFTEVWGLL